MKKRLLSLTLALTMLSSLLFSFPVASEASGQTDGTNDLTFEGNILKENTQSITTSIPCSNTTYHAPERMIDGSFSGDNYYKSTNTMDDNTDLVITINLKNFYNIDKLKIFERYIPRYGACSDSVTIKAGIPSDMKTVVSDGKMLDPGVDGDTENVFSFSAAVVANTIEITFAGTKDRGTNGECTYQIWEIEAYSVKTVNADELVYDGNILQENTENISTSISCSNTTYHSPKRMIDGSFSGDNYYKSLNTADDYTDLVVNIKLKQFYNIGQIKIFERYISQYGACSDSVTIKAGTSNDMKTVVSDGKLKSPAESVDTENIFSFYPPVIADTIEITFAGTTGRGTNGECTYQIWEIEAYSGVDYGVIMYEGSPRAKVGSELCYIDESNKNVTPEIKDGMFMAPAAFLKETLGLFCTQSDSAAEFTYNGKTSLIDSQKGAYSKNGHIYVPVLLLCEELGIKYESDINGLFFADISSDINWNDKTAFQTLSELLRDVVYEAPPTPEAVIEQLKAKNAENNHPRLFFDDNMTIDILRQRIENEPYASWADSIIAKADSCIKRLTTDPIVYNIPDGIRLIIVCERVLEDVENIGFAYLMTGDTKYSDKLVEVIMTVCDFPDWNPYHFLDIGHMAAAVALGYDWCYDKFTSEQRIKIKNALINYALKPVMEDYNEVPTRKRSFKWSEKATDAYPNNWIAICTGGTIMAALAIGDEDLGDFTDAGKVVTEGMKRFKDLADSFLPDGGFLDGSHYWEFAMKFIGNGICSMLTSLGTDYSLSKSPGFNVTFDWISQIVGPKGAFNFDSASASYIGSPEFLLFGKLTGKNELINHRINQQFAKRATTPVFKDILWYDGEDYSGFELPLEYHSRGATNLSVLKTGSDNYDTWVSMYGGYRKKAGGAMQDFDGTFVLDMIGKRWALDYGAEYNTYHSSEYAFTDYYVCRPEGHNTVIISETSASGHDSHACGTLINSLSNNRMAMAVYDLTDQLDNYGANSWIRGIKLDRTENRVTVQDELKTNGSRPFYWFMHTEAAIQITDGGKGAILTLGTDKIKASLVTDDQSLVFTVMDALPLPTSPNPPNQTNTSDTRKLTIHSDSVTEVNLAVEFVPYYGDDEAVSPEGFTNMSDWQLTDSTVTVIGSYSKSNGTGVYSVGETVTVDAGEKANAEFVGWDAEGIVLRDATKPQQSFIMPNGNVKLKAKWLYKTSLFDIDFENWNKYDDYLNTDGTSSGFACTSSNLTKTAPELTVDAKRRSKTLKLTTSSASSYVRFTNFLDFKYPAFPSDQVVWGEFSVKFEGQFAAVGYEHYRGYSPICISSDGTVRRFDKNATPSPIKSDTEDMYQLELGKWYHIVWAMDSRKAPSGYGGPLYAWVNGENIINGTDYSSQFQTENDGKDYFGRYHLYVDKPTSGSATVYLDNLKGYMTSDIVDRTSKELLEISDDGIYQKDGRYYIDCISLSDEEIKAKLFVAVYDGTRLDKISEFKDITILHGTNETEAVDISFVEPGESYKVFIWDSTETIKPLCKSKVFTK